jgi:phosphate transport system permease protein
VLLAVMILPTVMTLADDALRGVSAAQRHAARGLGLTSSEVAWHVSLPQASRGLVAALLLGLGRALGEAIAVFLVVGRQDNQWPEKLLSLQPLIESGQTITTKLAGSETNIAYANPVHWGAICGLSLILMVMVAGITLASAVLQRLSRHAS